VRPMCVPPAARCNRCGTSTRCAARATRLPAPASAGGGHAPCGPCACPRRRVTIAAGRARAVPPAQRDRPPQPALADGVRSTAQVCAAGGASRSRQASTRCAARTTRPPSFESAGAGGGPRRVARVGASRSRRDEHTLCRPRDATALPTARSFSPAVFTECASVRGFRRPSVSALRRRAAMLRVTSPFALVAPPPRRAAPALARSRMRRSRLLCSLISAGCRQQPQPQLLLSADSALTA
jgi:hypothetical protein